jgi:hypothetical protein
MMLDIDKLIQECKAAKAKTGEDYFSFRMEINPEEDHARFSSYTPGTGHSRDYNSPLEAIADTVKASAEPQKLIAQAEMLESESRKLRIRAKLS